MNIELTSLTLKNFKGIKDLTVNFSKYTNIKGENGLCKTTIFDGYRWLLFNKNSADEANFTIKTTTPDGQPIHYLEHEVSATLVVDGRTIVFKKILKEDWVKPKGKTEQVMRGHATTYFVNDVPVSQKEYNAQVDSICQETRFKLHTDPLNFPNLHWTKQREILTSLVGDITNRDVAQGIPGFVELLDYIEAKRIGLEQYRKELAAKKAKLQEQIEQIPTRIDEATRNMPNAKDWAFLENEINEGNSKVLELEGLISGKIAANAPVFEENKRLQAAKNQLIEKRDELAFKIRSKELKKISDAKEALETIKFNLNIAKQHKENCNTLIGLAETDIEVLKTSISALATAWRSINARTIEFKEYDFCCPTCQREYDAEKYESIQTAMTEAFNNKKAEDLKANEKEGLKLVDKRKTKQSVIDANKAQIIELDAKIEDLRKQYEAAQEAIPVQPDIVKVVNEDADFQQICQQIESIVIPENPVVDVADLEHRKSLYKTGVDNATKQLNDRDAISKANERIAELKEEQRGLAQKIADIESSEFTIQSFEKAKIELIESKVNSMFSLVRFKMFEQQLNGGEAPTCVCTVDGIPYPDLNTAMKINAGMDIINTLSRASGIYAPIFIDGRESVNKLVESQSQIINLIVTKDKQLIVEAA